MYFQQEQEYMSEPIDEMSESSYIKINKRFLEELKETHDMGRSSGCRQEEDDKDEQEKEMRFLNSQKTQAKVYGQKDYVSQKKSYQNSPIKSNYYKDIIGGCNQEQKRNNSNTKSSAEKNKNNSNQSLQKKNRLQMKLSQKISNINRFEKRQACTPEDSTFEYYLLKKSNDRNPNKGEVTKCELNSSNGIDNEMQTKAIFSSKNQFSSSYRVQQNNQKAEFQRINYKKLLELQIIKNKQLQRQIYKLQSKLAHLNLQYEESNKSAKRLQKQITAANKIRKENKNRMKELDLKLQGFKSVCRVKNSQKEQLMVETRKENKILREENQKYRVFTQTLAESIFVLKGKKPKSLEEIWGEWKEVFERFSQNKWSLSKTKPPNKRV